MSERATSEQLALERQPGRPCRHCRRLQGAVIALCKLYCIHRPIRHLLRRLPAAKPQPSHSLWLLFRASGPQDHMAALCASAGSVAAAAGWSVSRRAPPAAATAAAARLVPAPRRHCLPAAAAQLQQRCSRRALAARATPPGSSMAAGERSGSGSGLSAAEEDRLCEVRRGPAELLAAPRSLPCEAANCEAWAWGPEPPRAGPCCTRAAPPLPRTAAPRRSWPPSCGPTCPTCLTTRCAATTAAAVKTPAALLRRGLAAYGGPCTCSACGRRSTDRRVLG